MAAVEMENLDSEFFELGGDELLVRLADYWNQGTGQQAAAADDRQQVRVE